MKTTDIDKDHLSLVRQPSTAPVQAKAVIPVDHQTEVAHKPPFHAPPPSSLKDSSHSSESFLINRSFLPRYQPDPLSPTVARSQEIAGQQVFPISMTSCHSRFANDQAEILVLRRRHTGMTCSDLTRTPLGEERTGISGPRNRESVLHGRQLLVRSITTMRYQHKTPVVGPKNNLT